MDPELNTINIRVPTKVLHFSDGTLEIFDDDEEKKTEDVTDEPVVDEVSSYKGSNCCVAISLSLLESAKLF